MIKFIGENTERNIKWEITGNSYRECWFTALDVGIVHFDTMINWALDRIGYEPDDPRFYDSEGEFDEEYYRRACQSALNVLIDHDYIYIFEKDDGNAYYQEWMVIDDDEPR